MTVSSQDPFVAGALARVEVVLVRGWGDGEQRANGDGDGDVPPVMDWL